jgi:hypothetical protein
MLTGLPFVVSVPARELAASRISGSLFAKEELAEAPLSDDLRAAIRLLEALSGKEHPLLFVARPEIFTHGPSLDWLLRGLGGIRDHVCISDGQTLRPLPGLRNHLFLYRLGIHANSLALDRLLARAPELLTRFHSQITTVVGAALRGRQVRPPPVGVFAEERGGPVAEIVNFYCHPNSVADSVKRMLAMPVPPATLRSGEGCSRLVYIPLTETAAQDVRFCEILAAHLAKAYFDPSLRLCLALPFLESGAARIADRIERLLKGLHGVASLPRARAQNIFVLSDRLDRTVLSSVPGGASMVAHESFDFWRHPRDFYAALSSLKILARSPRAARELANLLPAGAGRNRAVAVESVVSAVA